MEHTSHHTGLAETNLRIANSPNRMKAGVEMGEISTPALAIEVIEIESHKRRQQGKKTFFSCEDASARLSILYITPIDREDITLALHGNSLNIKINHF